MTTQFVAFSGGADSTALALLSPEAVPVFTDTGWEFDSVYAHLDGFEHVTGRSVLRLRHPLYTLPEYIQHSAFLPGHGSRYCTRMFKIEVYNHFIQDHLPAELLVGLRADEDPTDRIGNLTEMNGLTIRYPLREQGLRRADVVRICLSHNLLPRGEIYMARGGCKGCFYKRKSEVKAMVLFAPDVIDELIVLEESVQDERGKFAFMFPNAGTSIREIKAQVEAQPLLFDVNEVYAAANDKSDVGQSCGLFCNR